MSEIRNKIAHFLSTYVQSENQKDDKILLLKKKRTKPDGKDTLEVTDELVQEISKRYFSIMKGVIEAQNRLVELERMPSKRLKK